MKIIICIIVLLFTTQLNININGQEIYKWEKLYSDLLLSEDCDADAIYDNFDFLCELEANPINLNTATREELEQIPFLTPTQIEEILSYIYQYHGMETLGELMMIESLDKKRRELLSFFVYVRPIPIDIKFPNIKTIFNKGSNEIMVTNRIPFYQRNGKKNGYLGYAYSNSLRYKFSYSKYFQIGFVGSQDSGEPFLSNKNKFGYDYYSFYLKIKDLSFLKTGIIGCYKLRFGNGLVINNDFSLGKLVSLLGQNNYSNYVRGHFSRSQSNYFQGIATSIYINPHIELTTFFSSRKRDAALNDNGSIKSLQNTGYHRTMLEMERKDNTHQTDIGGNIQLNYNGFHAGITSVFSRFNRRFAPYLANSYRTTLAEGNNFFNIGLNYGYINYRYNINGEIAFDKQMNIAAINSLSVQPNHNLYFITIQRYYSHKYNSLFGKSFSEGRKLQNELGFLFGLNIVTSRFLSIMYYSDFAYFKYPRFMASVSSSALDNYISAIYTIHKNSFTVSYRFKLRQKDNKAHTKLLNELTHRNRISYVYNEDKWNIKSQIDLSFYSHEENSFGYMLSEYFNCTLKPWLSITTNIGYFHTKDFKSRLYTYERGMLYGFNFLSFYGKGVRTGIFFRAKPTEKLNILLKIGATYHFDKHIVSSKHQETSNPFVSYIDCQLRWKF